MKNLGKKQKGELIWGSIGDCKSGFKCVELNVEHGKLGGKSGEVSDRERRSWIGRLGPCPPC